MASAPEPKRPVLVAHRGDWRHCPENTLPALESALRAGAEWVEFDVQLSGDGVPVVIHDAKLRRTAGVEGCVNDLPLRALREVDVGEPARLGAAFRSTRIPTLAEVVALLERHPAARAFVEIKRASLRRFGPERVVERAMEDLRPVLCRCAVISYDEEALRLARARGAPAVGWIIERFDAESRARAEALRPEYVFADHAIVPATEPLWPGPWAWALYDAPDAELALRLAARGARFVETMAIGELLRDARLAPGVPARA